ncbi:putative penicillin-binding protein [Phaeosphaeria sp. MPI-PUGE-AT-0046c]|nr:putative penicillin-binding protein [Phaeosphaeria sp. MPI-PUGE-AT-0046c]
MSTRPSFDETFKQAVAPGPGRLLAGVTLAAARRSKTGGGPSQPDFCAEYGTLQLDPDSAAVTSDTVVWLASCTKFVTTIAALQCVERGQFTLDDPADIYRLLPEWKNPEVLTGFSESGKPQVSPAKARITLRQLLTHTSGLCHDFFEPRMVKWRQSRGETPLGLSTPVVEGCLHPLLFEPGSGWIYGCGLDLAGLMVARANETTLEEYMRMNIFDVLGMDDTSFHPAEHNNMLERLMPIATRNVDGELVTGLEHDPTKALINPCDDLGGTGLFGTAKDYVKLLKSILCDDGRLVKSETIEAMFAPALNGAQRESMNNSLSVPIHAAIMMPGEVMLGTEGAGNWTYGMSGLIGLHDSDARFKTGWMGWVGAPSLAWWIDREGGTCGMFATQLYPPGDLNFGSLLRTFQKEMVARLS